MSTVKTTYRHVAMYIHKNGGAAQVSNNLKCFHNNLRSNCMELLFVHNDYHPLQCQTT